MTAVQNVGYHTEFINFIAKKIKAKSYLEVGIFNPDHNFNKIQVADKVGVDPDPAAKASWCCSSDEYFKSFSKFKVRFDLIFCDGLHHADQLKKDLINSWEFLNDGGVIVCHDSNPHSERITHVPRDSGEWCGNIFVTVSQIISYKFTVDCDYGITVLHKNGEELEFHDDPITWEEFDAFRTEALNLVSVEEAKKIIDSWM